MDRQTLGDWGEEKGLRYLSDQGYQLLTRNWRTREGEIDLVMKQDLTIVFVEVKTRKTDRFGFPEESITPGKQKRLRKTCLAYLQENDYEDRDWRIDVVAIEATRSGEITRLDHYENAVEDEMDLG
jgi:putative endonuclease